MLRNFISSLGGAPSPGNATNHNHATAVTGGTVTGSGGSNFKRQNTVDAATIKENSARVSASRPSAPKNSPGQLDTSELILFWSKNICRFRGTSLFLKDLIRLFVVLCFFPWRFSEDTLFSWMRLLLDKVASGPTVLNLLNLQLIFIQPYTFFVILLSVYETYSSDVLHYLVLRHNFFCL